MRVSVLQECRTLQSTLFHNIDFFILSPSWYIFLFGLPIHLPSTLLGPQLIQSDVRRMNIYLFIFY